MGVTLRPEAPLAVVALLPLLLIASRARAATVSGYVHTKDDKGVPGLEVDARTRQGSLVGKAISGKDGSYKIAGLPTGRYVFVLNPLKSLYKGHQIVAYLHADGLCLNWLVSRQKPAEASAHRGIVCVPLPVFWLVPGAGVGAGVAASGSKKVSPVHPPPPIPKSSFE